jgi:hypothetical protein
MIAVQVMARLFRCKVQTLEFSAFPPAPSWLLFL